MRNRMFWATVLVMIAPVAVQAQQPVDQMKAKSFIDFDADGDGKSDKIMIMADGCEGDECPVMAALASGIMTLGYGQTVEPGYVASKNLGVPNPQDYPEQIPVVTIDGVSMAIIRDAAYPVADMVSIGVMKDVEVSEQDKEWLKVKLNETVDAGSIMKLTGDLTNKGGEILYVVTNADVTAARPWFLREAGGAEITRGYSQDYPRIYQNGNGLRIVSVSPTGLGVLDVNFGD